MEFGVLFAGAVGVLAFIWYLTRKGKHLQTSLKFSDPTVCAHILACTGYDNSGAKNQYSDVKSRAIPNERLVRAFGINNSFTTSRRKEFNIQAGKAIKMTEEEWQMVAGSARELVRQAVLPSKLASVGRTTSVALDSMIRSVCLKIVLHVLFEVDPIKLDDGNISIITEKINSLWIQSKESGMLVESDKRDLQKALAEATQRKWSNPRENPLNLILPAYETLWRVVLSGFLQVTFVEGVSPTLRSILAQFLANPTTTARKELVHSPETSTVSVDLIVKEALRLYPSVRSVYRQFHMDNRAGPENVAADIETCQRTGALWGADAKRFVPSRWNNASDDAQKSYMAFGISPFVCPAKNEFGPMMIGILMAAFADHVNCEDWHVKLGERSSGSDKCKLEKALSGEEPLVSDRSTYEGIKIVKK